MKELSDKLVVIESKVQRLIEENKSLREATADLTGKNNQLTSSLSSQKDAMAKLEMELQAAKNATRESQSFEKNNKNLKVQLEKYTKEIDKCIEWLSNS